MKAKDLRIGSLVNYEATTHIITTLSLDCCTSEWIKQDGFEDSYVHGYDQIEPIQLTEEWLLKFGFEELLGESFNITGYAKDSFHLLRYEKQTDFNGYWLKWYYSPKRINMLYVHQLQNLYFALTGEELTIK